MDNHPIPQDVTGFQFKLIGEMTIKQFAYLATGVVSGLLIYLLPVSFFIKFPFAFLLSFFGVGFAFFPVAGRPMDVMAFNFVRALFKPTQFVYRKTGGNLSFPTLPQIEFSAQKTDAQKDKEKGILLLQTAALSPKNKLDQRESSFFEKVMILQKDKDKTPKVNEEEKSKVLEKEASDLESKIETVKKEEVSLPSESPSLAVIHQRVLALEKELQNVLFQKEELRNEVLSLRRTIDTQKEKVFAPDVMAQKQAPPATKTKTPYVKQIPKGMEKSAGLPMPSDAPNLIGGILKDPRGNPLPNILVEIKDKEGNPVRAFKTNGLGQFISATPLLNGTYRIEFEDPKKQNRFDRIEFSAQGQPILPIEVTSIDEREDLRRQLFGSLPKTGKN